MFTPNTPVTPSAADPRSAAAPTTAPGVDAPRPDTQAGATDTPAKDAGKLALSAFQRELDAWLAGPAEAGSTTPQPEAESTTPDAVAAAAVRRREDENVSVPTGRNEEWDVEPVVPVVGIAQRLDPVFSAAGHAANSVAPSPNYNDEPAASIYAGTGAGLPDELWHEVSLDGPAAVNEPTSHAVYSGSPVIDSPFFSLDAAGAPESVPVVAEIEIDNVTEQWLSEAAVPDQEMFAKAFDDMLEEADATADGKHHASPVAAAVGAGVPDASTHGSDTSEAGRQNAPTPVPAAPRLDSTASTEKSAAVFEVPRSGEALDPDTTERIVLSIRLQYLRGGGEAVVQIKPDHLGPLTVSLRVEHGAVQARFVTEQPVVAEWLHANEEGLRAGLDANGLTLGKIVVERASEQGRSPRRDQAQQRPSRRRQGPDSTFDIAV